MNFSEWFEKLTGDPPFPYQERLAMSPVLPELLNVPTGAGKTAAATLGWLWRRRYSGAQTRKQTPRRLVYCLPVRSLVEQTCAESRRWLEAAGLAEDVGLHLLMGGAVDRAWDADPDRDCIIAGTQDQLLSRALNRGYAMSRYRWPIHFALLNNDCLWVMDETQLMGAGLQTTAQLQGFRQWFGTCGATHSLWMSATLDADRLATADFQPNSNIHQLTDQDLAHPVLQKRMRSRKALFKAAAHFDGKEDLWAEKLAKEILQAHKPATLTLVICNRVSRAQAVYRRLRKRTSEPLLLVHSRFRPAERGELNRQLSDRALTGIAVATQAIEAGVDISAKCLFTELAPWSSLVQRFGRCNRYGEWQTEAAVYWIDIDLKKKGVAAPYTVGELETARKLLAPLQDVGPDSLKNVPAPWQDSEALIPRKHDLLQLFDTSPDLAGHDIDISPFIRESDESDVAVAWREWEGEQPPPARDFSSEELCRVSVWQAEKFIEKAWVWDGLQGAWVRPSKSSRKIYAGQTLLLPVSAGGYSKELGWTGNPEDKPEEISAPATEPDADAADNLTNIGQFVTLEQHSGDVEKEVRQLCASLDFAEMPGELIARAARWHDLGKAHKDFQEMLVGDRAGRETGGPWAKSDHRGQMCRQRRGFRHELVSALVALQVGEPFLLCYLVAAHHGKVRLTIQPRPTEQPPPEVRRYALGVWENDEIPAVNLGDGLSVPAQTISLSCMELGDANSWSRQAAELLKEWGPFRLSLLETVVRIADWRASKLVPPSPANPAPPTPPPAPKPPEYIQLSFKFE